MMAEGDKAMVTGGMAGESGLAGAGQLSGEMTGTQVLEVAGLCETEDDESVFFYELFIATADLPPTPHEMPPHQWQAALKYRTLTPQEQAARERYFERKSAEALARISGAK